MGHLARLKIIFFQACGTHPNVTLIEIIFLLKTNVWQIFFAEICSGQFVQNGGKQQQRKQRKEAASLIDLNACLMDFLHTDTERTSKLCRERPLVRLI